MLRQPEIDPGIGEQLPDVSFGHGRMKTVEPAGILHRHELRLQAREFSIHPGHLLRHDRATASSVPVQRGYLT